jgi:mannose-6-phosphate isomerase-like protein (cupin superfamily)
VTAANIQSTYLRLRPDCSIEPLPFDATFWPRLISGALGSFHHEYLVTSYTCSSDWPSWEIHPNGDEIVCLMSGRATMVLEAPDGNHTMIELQQPGSYAFIPRGTWHTAKIHAESAMLFITAGEGTRNRPA